MKLFAFVAILALALTCPSIAGTVYSENFEGPGPFSAWTGAGSVQSPAGFAGLASPYSFGAWHWRNDTASPTTLTLAGLAPHGSMTLTFDMAMWDSIDQGSDWFQISVNGAYLYNNSFGNYYAMESQGPGVQISAPFTAFEVPNYGYAYFRDAARHVSYTFAHSAATATIVFQFPNSQGGMDESFGIDNLTVQTDAPSGVVPEPSGIILSLAGLGALAWLRRKSG